MKHLVFLYAREDKREMHELREHFQNKGITVWTDENIPRNSIDWQKIIEEAIESSFAVVVLMSPSAKNSSYVRQETNYALIQKKSIFPVLIKGNARSSIPIDLINANYTKLVGLEGQARTKVIKSLFDSVRRSDC